MSIQSWIEEYYPVMALEVASQTQEPVPLLEHALRKWIGLRAKNLKKHGLEAFSGVLRQPYSENFDELFFIDANSCSLCEVWEHTDKCPGCPLYEIRGNVRCDHETLKGCNLAPYKAFVFENNPEPMIRLLRRALKKAKQGETK